MTRLSNKTISPYLYLLLYNIEITSISWQNVFTSRPLLDLQNRSMSPKTKCQVRTWPYFIKKSSSSNNNNNSDNKNILAKYLYTESASFPVKSVICTGFSPPLLGLGGSIVCFFTDEETKLYFLRQHDLLALCWNFI